MSAPLPDTCNGVACRLCVGGPSCADVDRIVKRTVDTAKRDELTDTDRTALAFYGTSTAAIRAATEGGDA